MSGIVFRSPNWLGDAVMATVVPPALGRAHDRVAVLTPAAIADLWRAAPGVDDVVPFESGGEVDAYRRGGYDRVLLGPVSFGSAWRALRGGVRERYGFAGAWRGPLLARQLPGREYRRDRHQVENYRALAGLAGEPRDEDSPSIRPREEWRQEAEELWPRSGAPRAVVQPGATFGPAKRWPAERFARVTRELGESGAQVAIVGGPGDAAETATVAARVPEATNLGGRTSVGVLAAVLESADVLITNDTGPMHLAAAVGTPTVAIFGSTSPVWTRPWGERHRVVSHAVECQPCFRRDCRIGYVCLTGVETERVIEQARTMLEEA